MKYNILLLLFAIIIVVSGILTFVPIEKACKSTLDNCITVHTSKYEYTFGIKNSHLGLGAFLIMFILTFSHIKNPKKLKKNLIATGLIIGTLFALYFLYVQVIILKATCLYCLIADFTTILSLIIFTLIKDKSFKDKSQYEEIKDIALEITK